MPTLDEDSGWSSSTELAATRVALTLEEPLTARMNVVWSAAFAGAWQALWRDVIGEPPKITGQEALSAALNRVPDVRPLGMLYAAAGWRRDGIEDRIRSEMAARFPGVQPSKLDGDLVAYGYLDACLPFTRPYRVNRRPLYFRGADGNVVPVHSFGIRSVDSGREHRLREQPRILFMKGRQRTLEFAVDLCGDSSPSQIIVARIERPATLGGALSRLADEGARMAAIRRVGLHAWCEANPQHAEDYPLGCDATDLERRDVLLVPNFDWAIRHRATEIEGRWLDNAGPKVRVERAQQDIRFRLDHQGARLTAEAKIAGVLSDNKELVLSQPFLVVMKLRGAAHPYFVMWVDNAELLRPWNALRLPEEPEPPVELREGMVEVTEGYSRLGLRLGKSGWAKAYFLDDQGERLREHMSLEELHGSRLYLELEAPKAPAEALPALITAGAGTHGSPTVALGLVEEPVGGVPRDGDRVVLSIDLEGPGGDLVREKAELEFNLDPTVEPRGCWLVAVRDPERHAAWLERARLPRYGAARSFSPREDGAYLATFAGNLDSFPWDALHDPLFLEIEGGDSLRDAIPTHLYIASWTDFGTVIAGKQPRLATALLDEPPPGLTPRPGCAYLRLEKEGATWQSIEESGTMAVVFAAHHGTTKLRLLRQIPPICPHDASDGS
jgi:hypothetical protein